MFFCCAISSKASFIAFAGAMDVFLGVPPFFAWVVRLPGVWTESVGVPLLLLWRER